MRQGNLDFNSNLLADKERKPDQPRLLEVDNPLVIPVGTNIRVQIAGSDVIHSWFVPSFGFQEYAVVGRLNKAWVNVEREGTYYGECNQICGVNHAFMPIEVRAVSKADFETWLGQCRIGQKPAKAWQQLCYTLDEIAPGRQTLAPSKMIHIILEAIYDDYLKSKYANHQQRREDLTTLESFARTFQSPVDFLSQLSLMATADTEGIRAAENETEKITLSTIHQAKGLEWRVVFVIWLTDGMFPSSRSLLSTEAIEEERRLFYVASTRAQDQLFLTYPYYSFNGSPENRLQRPSRFLKEIPPDLVEELWIRTENGV